MNMSLSQLPVNFFDLAVIVALTVGLFQGRKHGMSEELLSLFKWIAIPLVCAVAYEPGAELIMRFSNMFSRLTCYLMAYVGEAVMIFLLFAGIKRVFSGKLVGSDIFGRAEYYLGMGSGLVRVSCVLLTALALLNARYFSPAEIKAIEKNDLDVYGSNFFPGLNSIQATVFNQSLMGPWIKDYLGFLLIKPTEPERTPTRQKDAGFP